MSRIKSIFVGNSCALVFIGVMASGPACAQNLDHDKSGVTLFAASCKDCHRSPRGLAKERFSWTLSQFLQQHYTSNSASAQVLTAYLQSADAPRANDAPRAKAQPAVRKSQPSTPIMSEPVLRPPASVPGR